MLRARDPRRTDARRQLPERGLQRPRVAAVRLPAVAGEHRAVGPHGQQPLGAVVQPQRGGAETAAHRTGRAPGPPGLEDGQGQQPVRPAAAEPHEQPPHPVTGPRPRLRPGGARQGGPGVRGTGVRGPGQRAAARPPQPPRRTRWRRQWARARRRNSARAPRGSCRPHPSNSAVRWSTMRWNTTGRQRARSGRSASRAKTRSYCANTSKGRPPPVPGKTAPGYEAPAPVPWWRPRLRCTHTRSSGAIDFAVRSTGYVHAGSPCPPGGNSRSSRSRKSRRYALFHTTGGSASRPGRSSGRKEGTGPSPAAVSRSANGSGTSSPVHRT